MSALFKKKNEEKIDEKVEEKSAELKHEEGAVSMPKGGDEHAYNLIVKPLITEKGSIMSPLNKYVFQVADGANKIGIKEAIKKLYKVEVAKVHILKVRSKERTVGRYKGHKAGFKKAIVTLKEGSKIDIAG